MRALREEISEVVLPIRRIFFSTREERGREGFLKGGLRRPSLGVMRNFWWAGGMESVVAMCVERSEMEASWGKVSGMGLLWWVIVRWMSDAVVLGWASGGVMACVSVGRVSRSVSRDQQACSSIAL